MQPGTVRPIALLLFTCLFATAGCVTHSPTVMSTLGNPAAAAANSTRTGDHGDGGVALTVFAGIENGNVEEIFDSIDQLAVAFEPTDLLAQIRDLPPGQFPELKLDGGLEFGDLIDAINPDLIALVRSVGEEITGNVEEALAVISREGYSKARISGDLPMVINAQGLGGTWTLGVNWTGTAKSFVVGDTIDFDPQEALAFLEDTYNGLPLNGTTTLDLPGDIGLTIDPTGQVSLQVNNDSLLLTKATATTGFGVGYGRQVLATEHGNLYLGVDANYYQVQLSRVDLRLGDITDSDEIFDTIRNAAFISEEGFGADLGFLWTGHNYQLGATMTNINEASFVFPAADESLYSDLDVIDFLRRDQVYTMERQLTLESSIFSSNRRWMINLEYDTNAVPDPMGDDYQWASVSAGYFTDSWWLPGIRASYRQNLAGTELSYVGVGVTVLKVVNFDVASTLDTVHIDGQSLPQGLMASLGFQVNF